MKCLFMLAVLLPFVFGAPQERFLIGNVQIHLPEIHLPHLNQVTDLVKGFAHSGMGQTACVTACGTAVSSTGIGALLAPLCPAACEAVLKQVK
ncbi:uncharacterized protein [Mytilus edulis]|nr:Hypothetical predicted protein [Mytilus galloprovincialis]